MSSLLDDHSGHGFLYLSRADVVRVARDVDIVGAVEQALIAHARGLTVLPEETYLGWRTAGGHAARSLAMAGAVDEPDGMVLGLKVINGSLGNPASGLARSQGFTMVFDQETARPLVVMEAAYISAMRTAAVTVLSARHLGPARPRTLALLGAGTLARAHLLLLSSTVDTLEQVQLYDVDRVRADQLAAAIRESPETDRLKVTVAESARDCVRGAELVVPVTTVTAGYLAYDWLEPGALLAHVSLDDALIEVVERAGLIVVDDWDLVRNDDRRLLGRMYRQGMLLGPAGEHYPGCTPMPGARQVDTTLGEVLAGAHPGRRDPNGIVLSNPFGLAILDVAVAARVHAAAVQADIGVRLPV